MFLVSEIAKLCVSASLTDCGAIEPDELLSMREILPDFRCCAKVVLVCCNADVKVVGSNPTAPTYVRSPEQQRDVSVREPGNTGSFVFGDCYVVKP